MSGGQWMVVLIVALVMIAKIVSRGTRLEERRIERGRPARINDGETERLREEVRALKERLAVLERIATDGNNSLERQIEALRDDREPLRRDPAPGTRRDRAPYQEERE